MGQPMADASLTGGPSAFTVVPKTDHVARKGPIVTTFSTPERPLSIRPFGGV